VKNTIIDNADGSSTIVVKRKDGEVVHVLVDTEDVERLSLICSTVSVDSFNGKFYAKTWLTSGGHKYLHRVICRPIYGLVVDHINRQPTDNRKCNLRVVTRGCEQ
jgi:hypothetical protein